MVRERVAEMVRVTLSLDGGRTNRYRATSPGLVALEKVG